MARGRLCPRTDAVGTEFSGPSNPMHWQAGRRSFGATTPCLAPGILRFYGIHIRVHDFGENAQNVRKWWLSIGVPESSRVNGSPQDEG